jgi:hypothetical protein
MHTIFPPFDNEYIYKPVPVPTESLMIVSMSQFLIKAPNFTENLDSSISIELC